MRTLQSRVSGKGASASVNQSSTKNGSRQSENTCQREPSLSFDEVEDLSRRREQLRSDVETSLARISEIQTWIHHAGDVDNGDTAGKATQQQQLSDAMEELRAAHAAVYAVPANEWKALRRLHQPPTAVSQVVRSAVSLLGDRRCISWESCRSIKDLPQRLVKRNPADVTAAEIAKVRRKDFNSILTLERVKQLHPALGPLHRWITAMLRASEATSSTPAADTVELMREMEEHAEYVRMAKDELAAIDALLRDVAYEAERQSAGSDEAEDCSSPKMRSHTTLPPTETLTSGRTAVTDTEAEALRHQSVNQQREDMNINVPPSPPVTAVATAAATAVTPVVPRLRLEACGVGNATNSPKAMSTLANGGAIPSIRERFEELRTTPCLRSPRLGRPITGCSARSVGALNGSVERMSINTNASNGGCGSAALLQERGDLLQRVHDLEDRLKEAHQYNPSVAEFQLMRDEMTATKQELLALREEHNQLLQQTKRYSVYRLDAPCGKKENAEACEDDDRCAAATTITALEEQLHAAHARIHQLETQVALKTLHTMNDTSAALEQSDVLAQASGESSPPSSTPASMSIGNGSGAVGSFTTAQQQQTQLQSLQDALAAAEERLNQEIHSHHATQQQVRQLQEELATVWEQRDSAVSQLKRTLEEREGSAESAGDTAVHTSVSRRSRVGESLQLREMKQLLQREAENRQIIDRLSMELSTLKRRQAEERQRNKELRAARALMLARLENAFAESLRRQEYELRAIPETLTRARKEMEQLKIQRS